MPNYACYDKNGKAIKIVEAESAAEAAKAAPAGTVSVTEAPIEGKHESDWHPMGGGYAT